LIPNKAEIVVGAGKGESKEVKSVEDFAEVWSGASEMFGGFSADFTGGIIEYDRQFVVRETYDYGEMGSASSEEMNDEYILYAFSKTETYCKAEFTSYQYQSMSSDEESYTSSAFWEVAFETYANEEFSAIRFSKFSYRMQLNVDDEEIAEEGMEAVSEMLETFSKILNKWVPISLAAEWLDLEMMDYATQSVFDAVRAINPYVVGDAENEVFKKKDGVYVMHEDAARELAVDLSPNRMAGSALYQLEEGFPAMCKVDLRDKTQSKLACAYSIEFGEDESKWATYDNLQIVFKNIDNTKISGEPKEKDLLTEEEVTDLFTSEEVTDDEEE
jgi:hypothetical protein